MKEMISVAFEKTYYSESEVSSAEHKIIGEPCWMWVKTYLNNFSMGSKNVICGHPPKSIWPELPRLSPKELIPWLEKQQEEEVLVIALDNPLVATQEIEQGLGFHRKSGLDVTFFVTDEKLSTGAGFYKKEMLLKLLKNVQKDISVYRLYKQVGDDMSAGVSRYWVPSVHLLPASSSLNRSILTQHITKEVIKKHLTNEVDIPLEAGVAIGPHVTIGKGSVILPGTLLLGRTVIGENCEIGPHSRLENAVVGNSTLVRSSHMEDSTVGNNGKIGPMSHIRPNSIIGDGVKIGNFVEIKNSNLGDKTAVSHLTYIGDSDVGENCNIGCGVVTVNYDGSKKYRTTLKDGVFVGCNTNLVAPVTMEEGSYSAAGSTITQDVPADALGIARSRQTNVENWVKKHKEKQREKNN